MKFKCLQDCKVADANNPAAAPVQFRKGEHDVDAYPEWAVRRMARLGYAVPVDEDGEKDEQKQLDEEMEKRAEKQQKEIEKEEKKSQEDTMKEAAKSKEDAKAKAGNKG